MVALDHLSCQERLNVQPGKGTALEEIIKKIETIFIGVYSKKTRGNRHKLEQGKLKLGRKRNFFSAMTVKPHNRLPREVVQSPSMEVLKTNLKP